VQTRALHIVVVLLTFCYGSVSLAEPVHAWARIIFPGPKPQRITSAKATKPINGTSYVIVRRHLPLTKHIEIPPHDAVVAEHHKPTAEGALLPLPAPEFIADAGLITPLRCRPPPAHMTIAW
jgi:hypothetical protein